MSITLAAGDTLQGVSGTASAITYTIHGDAINAGADAFKVLAQGQIPSSIAAVYTVPALTSAIIKTIHLANPTGSDATVSLTVNGTGNAHVILPPVTIAAGTWAVYADDGWRFYSTSGAVMGVGPAGPTGPPSLPTESINFVIDGGGSPIGTGIKGDIVIDFPCTIVAAMLLADQSGSIVIDIWKQVYASYPPLVAQSICASALPTLSSALKEKDTTLTGWTTAISAGDTLRYNVNSAVTLTRVLVSLKITRV